MTNRPQRSIYRLVGLLLILLLTSFGGVILADAAGPEPQAEEPLRVAVKEIEPFVIMEQEHLTGFSIELWQEIVLLTGFPFEYVVVETVEEQLLALANDEADVAIAAISMTPEREARFDFSYPYYRSGLQIMTTGQPIPSVIKLLSVLLSPTLLIAIGVLSLILVLIGHVVWFIERWHNPDFPHSYWSGIWEGLWWASVTVTTVGYGDKTVKGALGRILGIFWMFAGIFLIANFTAFVSAELTVAELNTAIAGEEDLPDKRIATVAGTTSTQYLREQRLRFRAVDRIEEAYTLLENNRIDAIVFDAPVLQHYAATSDNNELQVVGSIFNPEDYGIALPPNSPYEELINQALLELKANGTYDEISGRWFAAEAK